MNLEMLNNKKIAILGLGLENQALVRYLITNKERIKSELSELDITICDRRGEVRAKIKNKDIHWQLGKNYNQNLGKFDILFRSPGWPVSKVKSQKSKVKSSSAVQLFFELCPTKNIIGVTGTKGKGTTASLIYEILRAAGKRVWLGGNIGLAPFEFIDKIKANDWVVLELSSFQLEDMTVSPHIAVFTNFYSEHLAAADPNNPNYHRTLKDYWRAKWNIVKWQGGGDKAVLNYELGIMNHGLKSKRLTFGGRNQKADCFWPAKDKIKFHNSLFIIHTSLPGEHNKENIAAAVAVARIVGVKMGVIKGAVAGFKGLPHRLELARELNGAKYYDDSFATTPEAAIIALKAFNTPVVLLLGGADKGADFKELAKQAKKQAKFVVLLNGEATPRIKRELIKVGYKSDKMKLAHDIKTAVKLAASQAAAGEAVLLSTACASFGMFKNYKERGDLFKAEVKKLN